MRENQLPVHVTVASSGSNLDWEPVDGTKVAWSLSCSNNERAHIPAAGSASAAASRPKLGTWLLAAAVISVTAVYSICHPKWLPSCVAQTKKISKQLSADIETGAGTASGGTAVGDAPNVEAGTVPDAPVEAGSDNAMLPAVGPQSKAIENDPMNLAKTPKPKSGFLVPPPPATPCVLPPEFASFAMQPAQQDAASQQSTADSGRSEDAQAAALAVADQKRLANDHDLQSIEQELQTALHSSLGTVREWTR